jgi:uncharacterized protein (DUF58 family)
MHVQIFLDCSASMGKDNPKKAQYAIALAAALGFLAVHNMDKVSFNLVKGDKSENPYGTLVGKKAFFNAISSLEQVEFSGDADMGKAITSCQNTGTNDGLTVIISDFFTDNDWKKAVDYLAFKRRQVMLLQVLTPEEEDPSYSGRYDLIDSESEDLLDERNLKIRITKSMQLAYAEAFNDFIESVKSFATSREAAHVLAKTSVPIEKMLFGELFKVGVIS